ncbi:ANKRD17 [Symbiodinium sp. CCMP2592]|nr:ANKRD17 [Symbiodinium sp. CCMP2592]
MAVLHVWGVSGREVASIPMQELQDARMLKQILHKMCGVPRFRQRLLHDGESLDDGACLDLLEDVQLVLLDYCPASSRDVVELYEAAECGDVLKVEIALQRPQDPSLTKSPTGPSPLQRASRNGHVEVVRLLLEAWADMERCHYYGSTALGNAAAFGKMGAVCTLLQAGAEKDNGTVTPLYAASAEGHVEIVRLLLELRADVNKNSNPRIATTALGAASLYGHAETVSVLLKEGADKDQLCGRDNATALTLAARNGHQEVVRLLRNEASSFCTFQ